jgi:diguanylate cyclase (GGDEF)-like protein
MTPPEHNPAREPDEANSEREQRRRGRVQSALSRELAAEQRETAAADRDRSQAEADQRTSNRGRAADDREHAAADRDDNASHRDQFQAVTDRQTVKHLTQADPEDDASDRDQSVAQADRRSRDRLQATDDRERAVSDRRQTATDRDQSQSAADQRSSNRSQSSRDRERAAADRQATAVDRLAADGDHAAAQAALSRAQLDQLTGAFGRELGLLMIEREINRARHGNGRLVLSFIDVNGLKLVNDGRGHLAGDGLLRDVAHAVQKHLRSYDTLVRVGGDEFLCALADCTLAVARRRFQAIDATMRETQVAASISVGYAELHPDDDLETLTQRADRALYADKQSAPSTRSPR